MPDGRTHDFLTYVVGACATPLVISLPQIDTLNYGVLMGSYLASGLIFSNDLDLHSSNYDRWGPLRFIWLPYQKMIHHRSWLSHGLVFGPLLRIIYFAVWVILLLWLILVLLALLGNAADPRGTISMWTRAVYQYLAVEHPITTLYFLIGFIMGGAVHTVADVVSTWRKRHRIRW